MSVRPISPIHPITPTKREMKEPDKNNPRPDNIQLVQQALTAAKPWGLEAEVMWSALTFAAEANAHGQTMEEVLDAALGEWDIDLDDSHNELPRKGQMYSEDGSVNKLI